MLKINLESLIDFSAKLNEIKDEKLILNSALLAMMGKLKIIKGSVLILNSNNEFEVSIMKGYKPEKLSLRMNKRIFNSNSDVKQSIVKKIGYKFCIPVSINDKVFAIICLGNKIDNTKPNKIEKYYCKLISNITAIAIQNIKQYEELINTNKELQIRNQLLATLFEMSKDFNPILTKIEIIKILSFRLMGQLLISRFALILFDEEDKPEIINNRLELDISNSLIKSLRKIKTTIKVENSKLNKSVYQQLLDSEVKVISPLTVHNSLKGILIIGKKLNNEDYTQENLDFIDSLGNLAIMAIENGRLFNEELEKKRLEDELNLAYEIQMNLFPQKLPECLGYELMGYSIPSRHIGGDYYDFIKIHDDRLLIAIADISGKGIPAAILMSNLQASLRTLAPLNLSLKELMNRMNKVIYDNTTADKFVTLFCGILDFNHNTFEYVNAGHNPPIYYGLTGIIKELSEGGLILGIIDDVINYEIGHLALKPGDGIIFYTDGVTEARNDKEDEFSIASLKKVISKNLSRKAEELIDNIIEDLKKFMNNTPQSDDITMAIVRRIN